MRCTSAPTECGSSRASADDNTEKTRPTSRTKQDGMDEAASTRTFPFALWGHDTRRRGRRNPRLLGHVYPSIGLNRVRRRSVARAESKTLSTEASLPSESLWRPRSLGDRPIPTYSTVDSDRNRRHDRLSQPKWPNYRQLKMRGRGEPRRLRRGQRSSRAIVDTTLVRYSQLGLSERFGGCAVT